MSAITVRKVRGARLRFTSSDIPTAEDRIYVADKVWEVRRNGARVLGWYVVDGPELPGMTIVRGNAAPPPLRYGNDPLLNVHHHMATTWHIGIGPGDLARSKLPAVAPIV